MSHLTKDQLTLIVNQFSVDICRAIEAKDVTQLDNILFGIGIYYKVCKQIGLVPADSIDFRELVAANLKTYGVVILFGEEAEKAIAKAKTTDKDIPTIVPPKKLLH